MTDAHAQKPPAHHYFHCKFCEEPFRTMAERDAHEALCTERGWIDPDGEFVAS